MSLLVERQGAAGCEPGWEIPRVADDRADFGGARVVRTPHPVVYSSPARFIDAASVFLTVIDGASSGGVGSGTMPYEVEIKFRVANHDRLRELLAARPAACSQPVTQVDLYLNHPCRDFAETNEAFRIRQVGDQNQLTYKGPKLAGPAKTREEIEIPCAPGGPMFESLQALFLKLGFRPVHAVKKTRTSYHLDTGEGPVEISLDDVEGLGSFAEVEMIAENAADLPRLQAAVSLLAKSLELTEVEPRSYLRMCLERSETAP